MQSGKQLIAASAIFALLAVLGLYLIFSDGSSEKLEKPECRREITQAYSDCAGKVDVQYKTCMNSAKVLFHDADRSDGISACRRKAIKEVAACKEAHTVCPDQKTD
jgi:hypothetical protein